MGNFNTKKSLYKFKISIILFLSTITLFAQKEIELIGTLIDETQTTIPFASIILKNRPIGTSSTEDGKFLLVIKDTDLDDTLEVQTLGYEFFSIKIKDFIALESKTIILKESVNSLDEVFIVKPQQLALKAFLALEETSISDKHELTLLYRRTSSENGKARFFIEQYMKILDKGPSSITMNKIEVLHSRKSIDYRKLYKKEWRHSVVPMAIRNPLRHMTERQAKKTKWEKIDDTSYDDEAVIVLKGKIGWETVKLYIGLDSKAIYKVENSANNSIYIYKKNHKTQKMQLSYHSRQWVAQEDIPEDKSGIYGKRAGEKLQATYKHEVFVLDVKTNKKEFTIKNQYEAFETDIAKLPVPYSFAFWLNFKTPPETKYFKGIRKELESHQGVSLKRQFEQQKYLN